MNELELLTNFNEACVKYAVDNGGIDNSGVICVPTFFSANWVEKKDPDESGILSSLEICKWDHPSVQPTNEQLMTYTVEEVKCAYRCNVDHVINIKLYAYHKISTNERDMIPSNRLSNGDSIFNTDIKVVQVYIDSEWKTLQFL
jgi:hypothetical protein